MLVHYYTKSVIPCNDIIAFFSTIECLAVIQNLCLSNMIRKLKSLKNFVANLRNFQMLSNETFFFFVTLGLI